MADLRPLARSPYIGMSHSTAPGRSTGRRHQRSSPTSAPARQRPARPTGPSWQLVVPQGERPELEGGAVLRSVGGWQAVQALRREREHFLAEERVLGNSTFVEHLR